MKTIKRTSVVSTLLILSLFTIPTLIYIINITNTSIKEFTTKNETINQLKVLDQNLNHFIINNNIPNYDNQLKELIDDYNNKINLLTKNSKDNENLYAIDNINQSFLSKINLIKQIKTYNTTISSSLIQMDDLRKDIKNIPDLSKNDITLIDDTFLQTIQLYNGFSDDIESIKENIQNIKQLSQLNEIENINYFYQYEQSVLSKILLLEKEQLKVNNQNINNELNKLQRSMKENFNTYIKVRKYIMHIFILLAGFLIVSVLYLYYRSLKHKKELVAYKYAIENSDNSIVITDLDKNITYVNQAFENNSGYSKEEIIGQNPRILKSDLLSKDHYDDLNEALNNGKKWMGEFINKRKDGTIFYEKASIAPMVIDNQITGYISIKLNITDYIKQEEKIKYLAYHDPLTSLANRLYFEEYIEKKIEDNSEIALMYLDLDHFKTINDTLGHQVGDDLLKVFAKRLTSVIDKKDFIARVGGDEFVIVLNLEQSNHQNVEKIAQRVIKSLILPIEIDEHKLNITTSIGIALYPDDATTHTKLLKYADTAMYAAKRDGRNDFRFFCECSSVELV